MFYKIFNAGLRIFPLALKFILITALSKYLEVSVYGEYSLITTTITISIFVLGLDFYNFSIRDMLVKKEEIPEKIINTIILYLSVYIVFIFIGWFLLKKVSFINNYGQMTIVLLCLTEHFAQEIYRLQIAFKKVLLANVIFFLRVASWTGYILAGLFFFELKVSVTLILKIWLYANVIAILISFFALGKNLKAIVKFQKIDFSYLSRGLRISSIFFAGTIALKCIEYVNRYIVDFYLGSIETGIFSFYANLALVITVYINAIVISFELPILIEKSEENGLGTHFRKFRKDMLLQILVISMAIALMTKPILIWQGVAKYESYFPLLFVLLLGVALMNFSLVYDFDLYVKNKDSTILKITVLSCFVNLVLTFGLTYWLGLYGTAFAFMLTGLYMLFERRRQAIKENYG